MKSKILFLLLLPSTLFAEKNVLPFNQKQISLAIPKPVNGKKNRPQQKMIFQKLRDYLKQENYNIRRATAENLTENLQNAQQRKDFLYIDSYYSRSQNDNLNLYLQIYDPDKQYVIDAINVTDELEGLEGLQLDKEEMKQSVEETLAEAGKKLVLRLKLNQEKKIRRENIDRNIISTKFGKEKKILLPPDDIKARSQEVFKILSEKANITVASNLITDKEKQPASVHIIESDQIQLSGARTINELLTIYVPGFFTVEDQDDTIAGFRGFAPDNNAKVLLLLNGHNMNTEWFWGPPDSIINGIQMDFIERIEVIRGPGSVTLGQGALLGVINIVTKQGKSNQKGMLSAKFGKDQYESAIIDYGKVSSLIPDLQVYFHGNITNYKGQKIRPQGWAKAQTYESSEGYYDFRDGLTEVIDNSDVGGNELAIWPVAGNKTLVTKRNVVTSGSRLKKAQQNTFLSRLDYKGLTFTGFHTDGIRNLYNFYRDRNNVRNQINTGALTYRHTFSDKLSFTGKTSYTRDDVALQSNNGIIMGGTRENRYGGTLLFQWRELFAHNNLAFGFEFKKYDMGQPDLNGNNFITNSVGDDLYNEPNRNRRYVYPGSISVSSLLMEDFYQFTDSLDFFAAFRYDKHPYWGANISPRFGALYQWNSKLRFRFSYQQGYRGVVGVSYSGGFEGDGHLRIENFKNIELARIPTEDSNGNSTYYRNVAETKPEKMDSFELATNWQFGKKWQLESIFFYNKVKNIIDVGVIYADQDTFPMPSLGNDVPGDWNGYWYYKNAAGEIRQGGLEVSVQFSNKYVRSSLSHSLVQLITASHSQLDSIYLTTDSNNRRFKGFPENVTRWNNLFTINKNWFASINYLFYANWYSPRGNRIEGNHLIHLGTSYKPLPFAKIYLVVKNALNQQKLYPMISNSGGETLSDGSPAMESRTYWLGFEMYF